MPSLKQLFRFVISTPGVVPKLLGNTDAGVVFMLHRFPDPELGNPAAHDLTALRAAFAYMRRRRFELVPLSTIYERADAGEPLGGAIAFTIDDGYRDHASIAAPLFAEFDCPVTTFLTTGFLDGTIWFWWDQIDHVFRNTDRKTLSITMPGASVADAYKLSTPAERGASQHTFTYACKTLSESDKKTAIATLAEIAGVEIPARPPKLYAPMSWDDARQCERIGMTFGPHTVTHPILARTSDTQSRFEIEESWRRLTTELARPVPVFCYPNGQLEDFGERETKAIADVGLRGAVIGTPGYATGPELRDAANRFRTRRFAMPDRLADVIQYVTGLERVKARIRAARG